LGFTLARVFDAQSFILNPACPVCLNLKLSGTARARLKSIFRRTARVFELDRTKDFFRRAWAHAQSERPRLFRLKRFSLTATCGDVGRERAEAAFVADD
jgi:hypothetical protein